MEDRSLGQSGQAPLFVEIQNVDISSLDFQGGGFALGSSSSGTTSSKARHVTFVEATTLFLYVGSTSGTVYLFSRDTLDFLFMIPFTGGKVCNVVASGDESEVAVASIRGRVALYRISPTIHVLQSRREKEPRGMRSSPGDAFRHLYDVPYHVNNEVTEMRWSPNGKFLFVGDNQGVISQTDVASLDEFPRPPPSRIILRLQSRILQIDCSFPYLAISTLAATFLCDLEKEDFTRIIQSDANNSSKRDIKSAGLCFVPLEVQGGREHLLIGEVETGRIFRCGMDGGVISCQKVDLSPGTRGPVGFFDPKKCDPPRCPGTYQDFNYSPSKMFPTEDGKFIISVSSNRIFLYDAKSCQILAWNEDFNRINSLKIVANYGLLWYGGKLQVFALTPFRSYGRQLFKAGLTSLLENWISYTLSLLGYQGQTDAQNNNNGNNYTAIKAFREMMSPIEEDDEFCIFVGNFVPFDLIDPEAKKRKLEGESYDKKLRRGVKKLVDSVKILPSIKMPIHLFAMRRCLILPYLQSSVCDDILPDHVKLLMLSRSRVCSGLEHISFNLENLQVIRDAVTKRKKDKFASEKEACSSCRKELLSNNSAFEGISMDCVGVWMIENSESIEKFMEILEKLGLNSRGEFSLRFFQLIIRREELRNKKRRKEDAGLRDVVSLSNLTCSILHNKNK
ncbi:uncharacterized protein LOC110854200 isoform X3 [Folsomia candida]|uniref:uncharacterized protein LOC110854200 isoform X3 n=1 Tax=Folsomia candida TaxID=158441 RepID=UPI001604A76C|nr:uncharacterized protein LOC110854200 isoform X3 [Folsomia candida]